MDSDLTNAILRKSAYKPTEMRRYQASVIHTALAHYPGEIAADDIPVDQRPANCTTAGCVFALLKSEGVHLFNRVGRRASKTKTRHCAWINSYRLTSRALALTWLERNGFPAPPGNEQMEMPILTPRLHD